MKSLGENMIEFEERPSQIGTNIKIVGVGGAGGNAVNTMIQNELSGVEFIAANTDVSDLNKSLASIKLQIGKSLRGAWARVQTPKKDPEAQKKVKTISKATWKAQIWCLSPPEWAVAQAPAPHPWWQK